MGFKFIAIFLYLLKTTEHAYNIQSKLKNMFKENSLLLR